MMLVSCLLVGRGDLAHMKRLQMIDLTVAGFTRSPSNRHWHMEVHIFNKTTDVFSIMASMASLDFEI